jgi:DNA polymerase III subunit gamma/tau
MWPICPPGLGARGSAGGNGARAAPAAPSATLAETATTQQPMPRGGGGNGGAVAMQPQAAVSGLERFETFEDVIALIRARRDVRLLVEVETHVRLARYTPGRIEFAPTGDAPADLAARLGRRLQDWTGARWGVSIVSEANAPTIAEERSARRTDMVGQAMQHPLMQAVLAAFPRVTDADVTVHEPVQMEAETAPAEEDPDEVWDPLDDFD